MGYDVLIELGQKALDEAVDNIRKAFTKPYKRVIELRNNTKYELKLVVGYPTSFEKGAKSEFVNGPDATVKPESVEVFGVQGTRNELTGNAINGWCTYTCDEFDVMITYTVKNEGLGVEPLRIGVWIAPSGTITPSLPYVDYHVKYDKNSISDGKPPFAVEIIGTSGGEVFEFTLRPIS